MNIAVDYGNTIAKVGIFQDDTLLDKYSFSDSSSLRSFLEHRQAKHIILSTVSFPAHEVLAWSTATGERMTLSPELPLPVKILYTTPKTLGVDRIAAVCGALELFQGQNCLVIDAGTCITYEFLDQYGSYHGGGISPGIVMRFESMHTFTAKLPKANPVQDPPLVGDRTETSLQSGVINGVRAEVNGIIQKYLEQYPGLHIILCGGDAGFFENRLNHPIFAVPDLVLRGLNRILKHNLALA